MATAKPKTKPVKTGSKSAPGKIMTAPRAIPRRENIMEITSALFASRGYEASSMRDIAAAVGIMPASLYHHFPSKEDLLVSAVEESVAKIQRGVDAAIVGIDEPWQRLKAAIVAHVEALLDREGFRVLVVLLLPPGISDASREALIAHRKNYEKKFALLLEPFDLPEGVQRAVLQNLLLSMLNSIPVWYKEGGTASPHHIGEQITALLKPALRPRCT